MQHSEFTVSLGELVESNKKNPAGKFTYVNASGESDTERRFFRVEAETKPVRHPEMA